MGTTPVTQDSDAIFLQEYMATKITVQSDGAYSLKFPWKNVHPPLPTNYAIYARRTRSMVQHLSRTPDLLQLYNTIITDQETKGFIERVNNKAQYITSCTILLEKSLLPLLYVSCMTRCKQLSDSPSLNDCLHHGPPFLNDLSGILLRFRQHNVAFSSDIEKAFLQVYLDIDDRDFTRFLWLSD